MRRCVHPPSDQIPDGRVAVGVSTASKAAAGASVAGRPVADEESPGSQGGCPGADAVQHALLVRRRPEPFREDDLQALVRLLPIHERPSDSGPSPATAVATLAAVPRRPPQPSAQPGTAPTSRSARARERAHNHRIRSNAMTRTPPGARWRTAPAPPRRRSDRPARLRGSTSGWDRCARPSCAEPGTARRGTWCSRPAP